MSLLARVLLMMAACLALIAPARADVPILPLDQVEPGMRGHGRTVFQGTAIESFDIEVIGVLEGFDFQMDMILIRILNGPVIDQGYGVVAGMSGSPIYVDGKMIGALAYGWPFQKEAIAGVTPIEQMLEQYDPRHPKALASQARREELRERREQAADADSAGSGQHPMALAGELRPKDGSIDIAGSTYRQVMVAPNHQEAVRTARGRPDVAVMQPVSTPMMVGGVGSAGMRVLERLLEPYNIVPMQAGATRVSADTPFEFEPGAAVAVSLATGDIELTGIGTLTYVDGDTVLAFGHPMFGFGRVEVPMSAGYVHQVISSLYNPFKLGGAIRPVGAVTQDRPTCIGGKLGLEAETLPVEYRLSEDGRGTERSFQIEMMRQPLLTEVYTVMLMQQAMLNVSGGMFDGVTSTRVALEVEHDGETSRIERSNSFDSKATGSYGMNPLQDLFNTLLMLSMNPFGDVKLKNVEVDLDFEAERRFASIERVQAEQQVVKPGQKVDMTLYLKAYGGKARPVTVPVTVPENAPLGPMVVVLIGGNDGPALRPQINPEPMPRDVPSLIHWLNSSIRNDSVLVEMLLPTTGLEFAGHQLRDLPEAVSDALLTTNVEGMQPLRDVVESVVPSSEVVSGAAAVVLEVVSPEGERADGDAGLGGVDVSTDTAGEPADVAMGGGLAARDRVSRMLGGNLGNEFSWLSNGMARPAGGDRLNAVVQQAIARYRQYRPAAAQPLHARPDGLVRASAARRADEPAPPAQDAPTPADDGDEAETPDVTDELNLDKPPAMPSWRELEALGKGRLTEGGGAGSSATAGATEDEGEPLARPASVWSVATAEEFAKGRFDGTYLIGDGRIGLAPLRQVVGAPETARAWSVLPREDGSVLVGSWAPRATVDRVSPEGEVETLLETDDAGLVALAALPDGSVAVGGSPSGRIYKLANGGEPALLADLDERYIWALAPDGRGGLYAATGNRGHVYHIDAAGEAKVVLQGGDRHAMTLATAPDGDLYVGTAPLGKVYRIAPDGGTTSVFQSPEGAILSMAATSRGVYVGTAGTGRVYRIDRRGAARELVTLDSGHVYGMASRGDDVYATLGAPGRVVRLGADDVLAQLYRTDEPFLLGLAVAPNGDLVTTEAASGDVLRLGVGRGLFGSYTSPIHDAGIRADWGAVRWSAEGSDGPGLMIETRTGNTAVPDAAWSPWQSVPTQGRFGAIGSPAGRYLQFRAALLDEATHLDAVQVIYRTANREPTLSIEAPEPNAVVRKTLSVEWEAEDPDEDPLTYQVLYAPEGSDDWQPVPKAAEDEDEEGDDGDGDDAEEGDAAEADADEETPDAEIEGEPAENVVGEGPLPQTLIAVPASGRLPVRWTGAWPRPLAEGVPAPLAVHRDAEEAADEEPAQTDEPGDEEPEDGGEDEPLTDTSLEWDTTAVPDGVYRVKVVATDARRNPDDPQTVEKVSKPFRIDNTVPYTMLSKAELQGAPPAELTVRDGGSRLGSAEYRVDGGEWEALLPADGLFDAPAELLRLPAVPAEPGEHTYTLRVRDAVGNTLQLEWTWNAAAEGGGE